MDKKLLPGQGPNESIDAFAIRTWKADINLQREFSGDVTAWEAYCRAEASQQIRILGRKN